jgi:hypothetical protein
MYFEYAENPEEKAELIEKIKDYNEDDCIATREIKDWLEREAEKSTKIKSLSEFLLWLESSIRLRKTSDNLL